MSAVGRRVGRHLATDTTADNDGPCGAALSDDNDDYDGDDDDNNAITDMSRHLFLRLKALRYSKLLTVH